MRKPIGITLTLIVLSAAGRVARAADPPDAAVNPQTGKIETATSVWEGADYDVSLAIDRGPGVSKLSLPVSTHPADDLSPRLAIAPSGDTWVTWWRANDSGEVRVRKFSLASQSWSDDRLVSDPAEDSRNPELVQYGSALSLVYQIDGETTKSVAVSIIGDEPDPIGTRTIVASTASTGNIDARIQAEDGHVWVTWIQDDSEVGWSVLSGSGSWTTATYESYSGGDTDSARSAIRETVLEP